MRRWLIVLASIYLLLGCAVWMLQSFLVFPGAHDTAPDRRITALPGTEIVHLTAHDGTPIAAWYGDALDPTGEPLADAVRRPAVLYFYGNGACASYSDDVLFKLRKMGLNVIIPDFAGYGSSGGKPTEAGCYAAADAAYDELARRGFVGADRVYAMGWSLGAAVAIDLAARRPVGKLAIYCGFTNLPDMGREIMPWLPTSLLLSWKFDNIAKIPSIRCPIFFVHGTADSIVPFRMQAQLAAAATSAASVTVIKIPGSDHNDIFEQGGDNLWTELGAFFNQPPLATTDRTSAG